MKVRIDKTHEQTSDPLRSDSPRLRLSQEQMKDIGRVVAASIRENVVTQRQADGSAIKSNKPATIESKLRRGLSPLSLIDAGRRLELAASYVVSGARNTIEVRLSHSASRGNKAKTAEKPSVLAQYVQERGYTGWFAPSAKGIAAVRAYLRQLIVKGGV